MVPLILGNPHLGSVLSVYPVVVVLPVGLLHRALRATAEQGQFGIEHYVGR